MRWDVVGLLDVFFSRTAAEEQIVREFAIGDHMLCLSKPRTPQSLILLRFDAPEVPWEEWEEPRGCASWCVFIESRLFLPCLRLGSMWSPKAWGWFRSLGLEEALRRKPWVILNDARNALEDGLALRTDELLLLLQQEMEEAAVGLAHVSGNIYLGPALEDAKLSAPEALMANLFSHGEIGLDAVVVRHPDASLAPLATWRRLRWLAPRAVAAATELTAPRKRLKPVSQRLLKAYPLMHEVVGEAVGGTCLQHGNFQHHDIVGETLEECQRSCAEIAARRSYPQGAGCALMAEGKLFSGSRIVEVSPLQCGLVSLKANGGGRVTSVAWMGPTELLPKEQQLMKTMPEASFYVVE